MVSLIYYSHRYVVYFDYFGQHYGIRHQFKSNSILEKLMYSSRVFERVLVKLTRKNMISYPIGVDVNFGRRGVREAAADKSD